MAQVPPLADQDFNIWTGNLSAKLTLSPTVYGTTTSEASALASLLADYSARLATALHPDTRNKGTVAAKNTSKKALLAKVRQLVRTINGYAPLTDQQRADLGLNVRDAEPTPFPPPETRPVVTFDAMGPLQNSVRIVDQLTPASRARPRGTIGCEIWVKIGGEAPAGIDECSYKVLATRNRTVLSFPPGSGNKVCYVIGRWINPRGQTGPVSNVASASIAA